ncbi:nucleotidyltransferase family protein [Rhodocista pekingensis]|uniref:Nucleotidyltransferase family protein n=1 Tax=Rhodocista pekingensis TaxID=201185 RepID=A0ABW2KV05_9PROT
MALPVQSVRAAPEHRELLRRVADLLRAGRAEPLRAALDRLEAAPGGSVPAGPVGPFVDEAAALGFLCDRLVAELRPRQIWLFGSRARGDARPDSDIDLLVVLPDGLEPRCYAPRRVLRPVAASGLAVDIVPAAWGEFVAARGDPGALAHRVVREGRLLYAAPDLPPDPGVAA